MKYADKAWFQSVPLVQNVNSVQSRFAISILFSFCSIPRPETLQLPCHLEISQMYNIIIIDLSLHMKLLFKYRTINNPRTSLAEQATYSGISKQRYHLWYNLWPKGVDNSSKTSHCYCLRINKTLSIFYWSGILPFDLFV